MQPVQLLRYKAHQLTHIVEPGRFCGVHATELDGDWTVIVVYENDMMFAASNSLLPLAPIATFLAHFEGSDDAPLSWY